MKQKRAVLRATAMVDVRVVSVDDLTNILGFKARTMPDDSLCIKLWFSINDNLISWAILVDQWHIQHLTDVLVKAPRWY